MPKKPYSLLHLNAKVEQLRDSQSKHKSLSMHLQDQANTRNMKKRDIRNFCHMLRDELYRVGKHWDIQCDAFGPFRYHAAESSVVDYVMPISFKGAKEQLIRVERIGPTTYRVIPLNLEGHEIVGSRVVASKIKMADDTWSWRWYLGKPHDPENELLDKRAACIFLLFKINHSLVLFKIN